MVAAFPYSVIAAWGAAAASALQAWTGIMAASWQLAAPGLAGWAVTCAGYLDPELILPPGDLGDLGWAALPGDGETPVS